MMFNILPIQDGSPQQPPEIDNQQREGHELSKEELRRLMYERIARGNALAEVEQHSNRRWRAR